ncbi:MAG: segregation/condensation protein A [Oscillospiraceae bacterium]|nr:segregation/condensation protein A [Oscillospiraceae bacterium]
MEKMTYRLEQFEGPLDLLLFLISKHKLNIYDIVISRLLEQYLDSMEGMDPDMETASEFLEMASRLVQIKSAMLLPRHEEEGEQLKRELTGQLLEYQACKEAAALLAQRYHPGERFVRAPLELEPDKAFTGSIAPGQLLGAYLATLGKAQRNLPPPAAAFSGIVRHRVVSVGSRIIHVLKRLYRQEGLTYRSLFDDSEDRSELVATFLAVLELVKSKRIEVAEGGEIHFRRGQPEDAVPLAEDWEE